MLVIFLDNVDNPNVGSLGMKIRDDVGDFIYGVLVMVEYLRF